MLGVVENLNGPLVPGCLIAVGSSQFESRQGRRIGRLVGGSIAGLAKHRRRLGRLILQQQHFGTQNGDLRQFGFELVGDLGQQLSDRFPVSALFRQRELFENQQPGKLDRDDRSHRQQDAVRFDGFVGPSRSGQGGGQLHAAGEPERISLECATVDGKLGVGIGQPRVAATQQQVDPFDQIGERLQLWTRVLQQAAGRVPPSVGQFNSGLEIVDERRQNEGLLEEFHLLVGGGDELRIRLRPCRFGRRDKHVGQLPAELHLLRADIGFVVAGVFVGVALQQFQPLAQTGRRVVPLVVARCSCEAIA